MRDLQPQTTIKEHHSPGGANGQPTSEAYRSKASICDESAAYRRAAAARLDIGVYL
jgi:hypothetical protein